MSGQAEISVVVPVLINEPWQVHMTECAVKIMRDTTSIPFQLIIAESVTDYCKDMADVHIQCEKSNWVKEANQAIKAADGKFIVHTGNDIFTKPGWLEALLECFEIEDCGIATLASSDLDHVAHLKNPEIPQISEGVYGPFFMMRKGWEFDEENYENIFGDTDLIMRHYEAGFRSYRNRKVTITHLYQQTFGPQDGGAKLAERFNHFRQVFYERHKASPHFIFRALYEGIVI